MKCTIWYLFSLVMCLTGRFCQFDYGLAKNSQLYGDVKPLAYKLDNLKAPISLHYSDHDSLSSYTVSELLAAVLNTAFLYQCLPHGLETTFKIWISSPCYPLTDISHYLFCSLRTLFQLQRLLFSTEGNENTIKMVSR